ncbi:hypothetical protein M885DRAFT_527513 [Pelagophyceae sp. CCMP2097]|nr:hypothetical protein M885DRAFT_527513 [Pelagophyceae sp. CCMP2097]
MAQRERAPLRRGAGPPHGTGPSRGAGPPHICESPLRCAESLRHTPPMEDGRQSALLRNEAGASGAAVHPPR